jgi:hypothetical protein
VRKSIALLVLAALAPSCGPATLDRAASAREMFEDWVRACVGGDAAKVFHGMSDAYKSGWLFDRLEESDAAARRWRGELSGTARTDLDLWLGVAKKKDTGRESLLPSSVLDAPTLPLLFKELFMKDYGAIQLQMSRIQIAQVYSDDSGVTVAVKNGLNTTELYGLIYERDGWKIDAHRQPLTQQGR